MTITGPAELEKEKIGHYSLGILAEPPYGNSGLTATCECEVAGGDYALYQGVGPISFGSPFELTPDYDRSIALMFIPRETADYVITMTLRSAIDGQELATATHTVKTGIAVSAVGHIDDKVVDYGTPLEDIGLPEQVNVTLTDGTTCLVDVEWDTGSPVYDGNKRGTYRFTGTLVLGTGIVNPGGLEVTLDVKVVMTSGQAKAAFLAALDDKVQAIEVAAVTLDGEDVLSLIHI